MNVKHWCEKCRLPSVGIRDSVDKSGARRWASLLACALAAISSCPAHAASSAVSGDVLVDTRGAAAVPTITLRRVTAEVVQNNQADVGVDVPLQVKGTDKAALQRLPELPPYDGGVIADGVTPLVVQVSAPAGLTAERSYRVKLDRWGATYLGPSISQNLRVLSNNSFVPSDRITLGPANPNAFVVFDPIEPRVLSHTSGGYYSPMTVQLSLIEEGVNRNVGSTLFNVRKPPVVLVHGYNADANTWKKEDNEDFLNVLRKDRGEDFVIRVNYGTANNKQDNTFGPLKTLCNQLDTALNVQVEGDSALWRPRDYAWTRYDVVGHSQGGVLLRFLCSSRAVVLAPLTGEAPLTSRGFQFTPFRHASNFHRGRFRRVVTIGSPHVGSTIAQLAIRMGERGVPFGVLDGGTKVLNDYTRRADDVGLLDRLLQKKFMITEPPPSSAHPTVRTVAAELQPDPTAKLHFLGTTILEGRTPAPGFGVHPRVYRATYLDSYATYGQKKAGEWVVPAGSDGVVDLRSQLATASGSSTPNASSMPTTHHIAHGAPDKQVTVGSITYSAGDFIFGTSRMDTTDVDVAVAVAGLLGGDASEFGPMPPLAVLESEMDATANAIEGFLDTMQLEVAGVQIFRRPPVSPFQKSTVKEIRATGSSSSHEFEIEAVGGEAVGGPVSWAATIYGPEGGTSEGVTIETSGENSTRATVTIDAAVVGEVTLQVSYPSTTGTTIVGTETIIETRHPGNLTGIELRPDAIAMQPNAEVPLSVWGLFDAGSPCLLFTTPENVAFSSQDTGIATVSDGGIVTLAAQGQTTVTATYDGQHEAHCAVTVLGPVPTVTSPTTFAAILGQTASYQITADGDPFEFTATGLPEGMTVDPATGLISGTPEVNGVFAARVGATNTSGAGWADVTFTVDPGSNQAPTAIGLGAAQVPANQPAGTVIGALTASDPNPGDTSFTFALVSGAGSEENSLFTISGGNLVTSAAVNPATHPVCRVRVRCTDAGGLAVEQAFVLPVAGAPVIVQPPTDTRVMAGQTYTMSVDATGMEPLTYVWSFDGEETPWFTTPSIDVYADAPYSGQWTVTVSNQFGSAPSAPATVTIDPLSYGWWAEDSKGMLGDASDPTDDAFGLGVPNLLVYAAAGNGILSGVRRDILPSVTRENGQLVLRYLKSRSASPSSFKLMRSNLQQSWQEFLPAPGTTTIVPAFDPVTGVFYSDSDWIKIVLPPGSQDFFRLEVAE